MFSVGIYEIIVISVLMLLIIPAKDLPKIARNFNKTLQQIKKMYDKLYNWFNNLSDDMLKDDIFKTWEDRVEEKRAEYNINLNIENFIKEKQPKAQDKFKVKQR